MFDKLIQYLVTRAGREYSAGSRALATVLGRSFMTQHPWVFAALLGGITFYLCADLFAIFSGRAWYADGSWWFVRLLRDQKPYLSWASREFGEGFLQMPVFWAIKSGIRNLPTLSFLFSAPLFLHLFLSLWLCAWAAGRKNLRYLLFPLISLFAGSMNGSMVIVAEGLLMVSLYWALLFFILFCESFNFWKASIFAVMAFVSFRTYESMAYLGMILGALAIWRSCREEKNPFSRAIWIFIAFWFFTGALIAMQSIIAPSCPQNFEGFKNGFFSVINLGLLGKHPMLFLSLVAILFLSAMPFMAGKSGRRIFSFSFWVFCPFAVFLGFIPLFFPGWVHPATHYQMRGFYCFLPVPLTFVLLGLRAFPQFQKRRSWVRGFMIVAVLACAQITWHVFATMQWRKYCSAFCDSLASHKGIIPFKQTQLTPEALMKRGVVDMGWTWTYQLLSVLLTPGGKVRAIIEYLPMGPSSKRKWAFNARHPAKRPDLSAYGIVYEIEDDK
ncbi:MAG: hypothetical protein V1882_04770 [Candidatus Omnitrophota bacterium]